VQPAAATRCSLRMQIFHMQCLQTKVQHGETFRKLECINQSKHLDHTCLVCADCSRVFKHCSNYTRHIKIGCKKRCEMFVANFRCDFLAVRFSSSQSSFKHIKRNTMSQQSQQLRQRTSCAGSQTSNPRASTLMSCDKLSDSSLQCSALIQKQVLFFLI